MPRVIARICRINTRIVFSMAPIWNTDGTEIQIACKSGNQLTFAIGNFFLRTKRSSFKDAKSRGSSCRMKSSASSTTKPPTGYQRLTTQSNADRVEHLFCPVLTGTLSSFLTFVSRGDPTFFRSRVSASPFLPLIFSGHCFGPNSCRRNLMQYAASRHSALQPGILLREKTADDND